MVRIRTGMFQVVGLRSMLDVYSFSQASIKTELERADKGKVVA